MTRALAAFDLILYKIKRWFLIFPIFVFVLLGCGEKPIEEQRQALTTQKKAYLARINKLADESLKDNLTHLTNILFWIQDGKLERRIAPDNIQYSTSPYAIMDDYNSPEDMAQQLIAGLLLTNDRRYFPQQAQLELPFSYPFALHIDWDNVELADGTALKVANWDPFAKQSPPAPVVLWDNSAKKLMTQLPQQASSASDIPPIAQAQGTLTITVPNTLPTIDFSASDIGQEQEISGWRVKLDDVKGHWLRLLVTVPEEMDDTQAETYLDQMTIEARDNSGRLLSNRGTGSGPVGDDDQIITLLNQLIATAESGKLDVPTLEKQLQTQQQAIFDHAKRQLYMETAFFGEIKTIRLVMPGISGEKIVSVPLDLTPIQFHVAANQTEPSDFGVHANVYDHQAQHWLDTSPLEVDAAALDRQITIELKQGQAIGTNNDPLNTLHFHFPNMMSNQLVWAFSRFDHLKELVFLDSDDKPVYRFDPEQRDETATFQVDRIEYYPQRFQRPAVRVRGEFDIQLLPNISIRQFPVNALPDGYQMYGKQVLFGPHAATNQIPALILARDASGRFLKMITQTQHSFDKALPRQAYHFYNEPVAFVFIDKGETAHASYSFDIQLDEINAAKGKQ